MAKSAGLAPTIVIPVMFRVAFPLLERVAAMTEAVDPTVVLGKARDGVSVATGAAAPVAVPLT